MDIVKIDITELSKEVTFFGWVRFKRTMKDIIFLEVFDGTNFNGIQVVAKKNDINEEDFVKIEESSIYSSFEFKGQVLLNERTKLIEIKLLKIIQYAPSDESIPLQKKNHSLEFLREIPHLRIRTKTFQAIFKIRSAIMIGLHEFFQQNNFVYVNSPIITSNDAEGAGETFKIVTSDLKNFFLNKERVSLSVSGQLHAEAFSQALKKVYTLAPTFRAENSNTAKHASEFWMLEPEIAFADYFEIMDLSAEMLQFVAIKIKKNLADEINFLESINEINLLSRLDILINKNIKRLPYIEAIGLLIQNTDKFIEKNIYFGLDLLTEHEKFLASYFDDSIVFIYDYPKEIKAFYMKQNEDQKTVRGFDLILPEIGELIGGSERENNYDVLLKRIKEHEIQIQEIEWYLNLRKYGYLKSTGFGLGIERLVMYLTGAKNIRDVLPYPRTPGIIKF